MVDFYVISCDGKYGTFMDPMGNSCQIERWFFRPHNWMSQEVSKLLVSGL